MATKGVKEVEWAEVLSMAADISGAPKKQIEADVEAVDKSIRRILTEKQPKRDNDQLMIKTPFACYASTKLPETVITDVNGNHMTRPSCYAVNIGVPRTYIDAANIGFVDKVEEEKKDTKSA